MEISDALIARFWSKVDKNGPTMPHMDTPCWVWSPGKNQDGYGLFYANGITLRAHRYAYILKNGSIPEGMLACHKCDNPPCVNPDHLFLGTEKDNAIDAVKKGRMKPSNYNIASSKLPPIEDLLKLKQSGLSFRQIAKRYNVDRETVSAFFTKAGYPNDPLRPRSAKLTKEQVRQIRSRWSISPQKPEFKKELAREFDISLNQIYRIINYQSWPLNWGSAPAKYEAAGPIISLSAWLLLNPPGHSPRWEPIKSILVDSR